MIPVYDEILVIGIKYKQDFNWYIVAKDLCYMNSSIKNQNMIEPFLNHISKFKVTIDEIRLQMLKKIEINKNSLEEFQPVIMIDFDTKIFYLQYPEPNNFAENILDGWRVEEDDDFMDLIPKEKQYWLYKNQNLFAVEI